MGVNTKKRIKTKKMVFLGFLGRLNPKLNKSFLSTFLIIKTGINKKKKRANKVENMLDNIKLLG
jgi:hypothetical protein